MKYTVLIGLTLTFALLHLTLASAEVLRLDKNSFNPGEDIQVYFEASGNFDTSAWVGIIPSSVAHGSEAENDKYDMTYQYLEKRTSGTLTFKAPQEPGSYDLRMFDTDNNGREVASVSFVVQGSASVPVPANPPTNPPQTPTTPAQGEGNENINLTGTWSCDDGGTYYIRQIGNAVWWDGEDTAANPRWANVAHGTISGNTATLEYADVPEGTAIGYGTLVLDIISNDELRAKEKPESYGGSHWVRSGIKPEQPISSPVNPSVNQPTNQPVVASPWNDPSIRQLIDEWILQQDKCVKKVYPGAYIDKWGRICGDTGTTTISCVLTPDHPADWDSYHYLWFNNPCPEYYPYRVQAYVGYRQNGSSFDSLAGCKGEGDSCKA